ncbi:MAG TPA: glycoside hydrolase family 3 C-terminal domain-containing protein [Actinophytocola sp.]|uniref:beta-glucosidase n=1 Tax=Actinophytocola sp. TaxID=1872138 RepID=UPI002DB7046F|nr:glycoside hydrolase family 3 C-terminal domain-containing protein [Actinophytocola sp.]HEU5473647.1 glycoside hydrolase family 3 C-terminal domain-containing protein [Actinophytocola sp.]
MRTRPAIARRRTAVFAATLGLLVPGVPLAATPTAIADEVDCASVPWMDQRKSAERRARALLAASSLDQKLRWLDEHSANEPTRTTFTTARPREVPPDQFTPVTFTMPVQVPCTPTIQYTDAPSAIAGAGPGVTVYPANVSLSSSWDTGLAFRKGVAIGHEAWRKQRNVLLGPGIASGRDPRSGRTSEYLGEDPVLSGLLAGAYTKGVGANDREPVQAQLKHFVANEQETDRTNSSSNVDQRALREIYTLPYEIAVDRGDVGSVMCSFNQVNHDWACGSESLLRRILKQEIGFDGWVVTDFGARHYLTENPPSLAAGLDQELNAWRYWTPMAIKEQIALGRLREADVDEAAFRIVRAHIASGLFDTPRIAAPDADVSTPDSEALARTLAEQGAVLLKNTGILPLTGAGNRIAVVGPTAANTPETGDIDASGVCLHTAPNIPCTAAAPLDAITARAAAAGGTVTYANGSDLAAAAATAADADVAIVFGYYREGEFADRPNISLDGNGDALIATVAAANPNTVVVLQTGGPVVMPWLGAVKGVLEMWFAGEQMGPATAALLWGDVAPSGKPTHSFPRSEADLPTAGDPERYPGTFSDGSIVRPPGSDEPRQVEYKEGLQVGYRWYAARHIEPLFPFGHGLTYTTFAYDDLRITTGKDLHIRFRLTNTGTRTGTETAQAYLRLPSATGEPSKRLLGWQKVTLAPGRSRTVDLTIRAADLADLHLLQYWNPHTRNWTTAKGSYEITVGSSFDTTLRDRFTIR